MSSKIPLWGCSLNVFVIIFVFVFVFFFVFVGQVMFSNDPHQFYNVLVCSGRPEGFESNTVGELPYVMSDQAENNLFARPVERPKTP